MKKPDIFNPVFKLYTSADDERNGCPPERRFQSLSGLSRWLGKESDRPLFLRGHIGKGYDGETTIKGNRSYTFFRSGVPGQWIFRLTIAKGRAQPVRRQVAVHINEP